MKKLIITLTIFLITLISVNADSIFFSDHLEEGETTVYETEDGVYVVNLLAIADVKEKAVFRLNDEMSKGIKKGDSYVFNDGSEIVLRDLVITEAGEGNDQAYYYFYGTGKDVLALKNVSRYVVENKLCNFDGQCLNETKENCCYDCGCDEGELCINNKCVLIEEEKEEEVKEKVDKEAEEKKKEDIKVEEEKEVIKEERKIKLSSKTFQKDFPTSKSNDFEEREKKAAYTMLIIILACVVLIVWFVIKKKRSIF